MTRQSHEDGENTGDDEIARSRSLVFLAGIAEPCTPRPEALPEGGRRVIHGDVGSSSASDLELCVRNKMPSPRRQHDVEAGLGRWINLEVEGLAAVGFV